LKRIHILIFVAAFSIGSISGCDCSGTTVHCDEPCSSDADCTNGDCINDCCEDWECTVATEATDCAAGECCGPDHKCTTDCGGCETKVCGRDSDCDDLGVCMECIDKCCVSFACTTDEDCPPDEDGPRFCGEFDPEIGCSACEYIRCVTDAECEDPTFALYIECTDDDYLPKCSNGECICAHPCGAPCTEPQYCCKLTRTCDPLPDPCPGTVCPACQQINPDPGGILDDDACVITGANCECEPMPPLPDAFAGQHSAIAVRVTDGIPVISGYFGQPYGDLIFGVADSAEAFAAVSWSFIDGVPADAECVGAAAGPRGGIAEPGDDVGWDTDLALNNGGWARISYYDRDNGALKYAAFNGTDWDIHTVDDGGDTGRFSSIVLDPSGRPIVSYMTVKENLTAKLKVAWATTTNPTSDADWDFFTADAAPVSCQPSDCTDPEVCLEDAGTCVVPDDPADCDDGNGCPDGEVCVAAECLAEAVESALDDLPEGTGLFTNLALYTDGSPVVGYYDSTNGNLKVVWWNPGANDFDPPVILAGEDGGGLDTGNLGSDVSMFVTVPGNVVHLSYQDADLGDIYYMTFPDKLTGSAVVELIDVGARDANGDPTDSGSAIGDLHWVGNFGALLVDASDEVRVAYQDGTTQDLVYAIRNGAGIWTVEILARKLADELFIGAYGFFIDQALNADADLAHISNFKHNLRTDPWSSAIDLRVR